MKTRIVSIVFLLSTASCAAEECPAGFIDLGGTCLDLVSDTQNCGGIGNVCPPGQICEAGLCVVSCPGGATLCAGVCRDLATDNYNCGSCGMTCGVGYVCSEGGCVPDCPEGYTECSGTCKNLLNDPSHCGECSSACAAGEVCSAGSCSFTCPGGYTDCSGACADLLTDQRHCGTCGSACAPGEVCSAGTCEISCYSGLTSCSGECRDLMRDPENCGSCGTACDSGEVCYDGACTASCPGGFTDCSGSCRDLDSDRTNCGTCDNECSNGEVCNSGTCEPSCAPPLVNCSGRCSNTAYDPVNCGSCGAICALDEGCVSGSCETLDCPGCQHSVLIGTPDPATVFSTIEQTYSFDNNLVNCIWHLPSNKILSGFYSRDRYWSFTAGAGGYPQYPDMGTGPYDRMVLMPATYSVVHTDQDQYASDYNRIYIGTIDLTGTLGTFSTVTFSDGFTGQCNLISSSANEFMCFDGTNIRRYGTAPYSPLLTLTATVTPSPPVTYVCDTYCFGGTFAWDGMYYYFSSRGNGSTNRSYEAFDATGARVGSWTVTGSGAINAVYFDWSVGRYSTHDGYGGRSGGATYTWAGGSHGDDTHCFGPPSPYHTH